MSARVTIVVVGAIAAGGLALRLIGADWGAPYGYHFDEPFVLKPALRMVASGDTNPHFFNYPSAMIYSEAVIVAVHRWHDGMDLLVPSGPAYGPSDLGPWTWPALVDGRRLVAWLGALGVVAAAWLAFVTGGPAAAVVAAAVLATLPLHVEHAHYLTTDVPMATWTTLAFAVAAQRSVGWRGDTLAGALLGLAIATKYTAAFALPGVVAVSVVTTSGSRSKSAAAVVAGAAVAFAGVCPFAWLDWQKFLGDLAIVRAHYSGGHLGAEGDANWLWYLRRLYQTGSGAGGIAVLALGCTASVLAPFFDAGGERAVRDRDHRRADVAQALVATTALAWFAWLGSIEVRFERNLLPVLTLAAAASGHGIVRLAMAPVGGRRARTAIVSVVTVLALAQPTYRSITTTMRFAGTDTRTAALAWIDANVAAGSGIAREEYTPRPDPTRYRVDYLWSLGVQDPSWYAARGIQYLIASSDTHGRILADPKSRRADTAERYRRLFANERLATFAPGPRTTGPVISIYRLGGADDRSEAER